MQEKVPVTPGGDTAVPVIRWLPEPAAVLGQPPIILLDIGQTVFEVTFTIASDDDTWYNRLNDLQYGTEPDHGWVGLCDGYYVTGQNPAVGWVASAQYTVSEFDPPVATVSWDNAESEHITTDSNGIDGALTQAATIVVPPTP